MKVRASVKPICEKCKIIKRKGSIRVICENPKLTLSKRMLQQIKCDYRNDIFLAAEYEIYAELFKYYNE